MSNIMHHNAYCRLQWSNNENDEELCIATASFVVFFRTTDIVC